MLSSIQPKALVSRLKHIRQLNERTAKVFEKHSPASANRYLFILKQVFKQGVEVGAIIDDPSDKIKYLSEKQHERNNYLMPACLDKLVLASQDTVALDSVASKIIGLDPSSILTTMYAGERGLGISNLQDIKVVGENIDDVAVSDYRPPAIYSRVLVSNIPTVLSRFLLDQMVIRPRVIKHQCTGCFECLSICPTDAIFKIGKIVEINQSKCIHCMCCHEVCRFNAIALSRRLFGYLINIVTNLIRNFHPKS